MPPREHGRARGPVLLVVLWYVAYSLEPTAAQILRANDVRHSSAAFPAQARTP